MKKGSFLALIASTLAVLALFLFFTVSAPPGPAVNEARVMIAVFAVFVGLFSVFAHNLQPDSKNAEELSDELRGVARQMLGSSLELQRRGLLSLWLTWGLASVGTYFALTSMKLAGVVLILGAQALWFFVGRKKTWSFLHSPAVSMKHYGGLRIFPYFTDFVLLALSFFVIERTSNHEGETTNKALLLGVAALLALLLALTQRQGQRSR